MAESIPGHQKRTAHAAGNRSTAETRTLFAHGNEALRNGKNSKITTPNLLEIIGRCWRTRVSLPANPSELETTSIPPGRAFQSMVNPDNQDEASLVIEPDEFSVTAAGGAQDQFSGEDLCLNFLCGRFQQGVQRGSGHIRNRLGDRAEPGPCVFRFG